MNRYPYHRYLRYLVLEGDGVAEIQRHLEEDLSFIPPLTEDCEELIRTLKTGRLITPEWREKCDVTILDEESDDMDGCDWILSTPKARAVVEKALLDGMSARHTATIVSLRFGRSVSERSASLYRRCFWDTEALSLIDFSNYFALKGKRAPEAPRGIPLKMKSAFSAWEAGLIPDEEDLSTEDIVRTIQVDAFMHFKKASNIPSPRSQKEARDWAAVALRTSQIKAAAAAKMTKGDSSQESLPALKPAIYIPDHHIPTLAELHGSDEDIDDDPI